jgi:hypothetical protein
MYDKGMQRTVVRGAADADCRSRDDSAEPSCGHQYGHPPANANNEPDKQRA